MRRNYETNKFYLEPEESSILGIHGGTAWPGEHVEDLFWRVVDVRQELEQEPAYTLDIENPPDFDEHCHIAEELFRLEGMQAKIEPAVLPSIAIDFESLLERHA